MSVGEAPANVSTASSEAVLSRNNFVLPGLENRYATLPERFYARVNASGMPAPQFPVPQIIRINAGLAEHLCLDPSALASERGAAILSGNHAQGGSDPLAMAYAGHQFGHFVPQLGDGRARLLGELRGRDGVLYDLHLKGSGRTAFSRGGDGRAVLGPVLREYVVSETMAALGVPTTRALAAVTTGDLVQRERPLPGAVLTRVAASHLRVGTFQYFAAREDTDGLKALAEFAIARHYPEVLEGRRPARGLLEAVVGRQASLIAHWMTLGFVHGVMNTDNMSISGETIDYGPCAFLEAYDPGAVFSSIDRAGRYAYNNQASAAHWNLTRLAEALLPLLQGEEGTMEQAIESAQEVLAGFAGAYEGELSARFRQKLGLRTEAPGDTALIEDLLALATAGEVDFTSLFRSLCAAAEAPQGDAAVRSLFSHTAAYDVWAARWRARLEAEGGFGAERAGAMRRVNPVYIPRNHLIAELIGAAVEHGDFAPFEALLTRCTQPFEEVPGQERYATPARPEQRVHETFCGT